MTTTLTREEAQQVLDALNSCGEDWVADGEWETQVDDYDHELVAKALEILRARLAQPEPEPVAWSVTLEGDHIGNFYIKQQDAEEAMHDLNKDWPQWVRKAVPLYTAPPQREWQSLTDEDIGLVSDEFLEGVLWAEAKLKEKNT
jgi:hypothetical protein